MASQRHAQSLANRLEPDSFWSMAQAGVIIDVRSPSEFAQGHLPDAVNLPLFDDRQRAEVGTVYKNSGRIDAVLRGLNLVGPKMARFAEQARQLSSSVSGNVFVHCWRGGMRSESVVWLLSTVGLQPNILIGGYKAFRRMVHREFEKPIALKVISGLTGVGKTKVLHALTRRNEAVVDLEMMAHHRGSAFGSIGQPPQPTTEQFENDLFARLHQYRDATRIWIEDEGNRLGTVVVPPSLVRQLKSAPGVFLESSMERRIEILQQDYGDFAPERLIESVGAIRKRLGFDIAKNTIDLIQSNQIAAAMRIVLGYYDRTYQHAAAKMPRPVMPRLTIDDLTDDQIVDNLLPLFPTNDQN